MRHSEKKAWTAPKIIHFADAAELWEYYKSRGSPEERARLRAMLDVMNPRVLEAKTKRRSA